MEKIKIIGLFHLERILDAYGINTKLYGTGERKDIEDFYKEIESGESEIFEEKDRTLLRVINTVNLFIFHKEKQTNEYKFLREERQVFNDSRIKIRNLIPSLSEKKIKNENSLLALQRGVKEELGFLIDLNQIEKLPSRIETQRSKSYLINTKNYLDDYFYLLDHSFYKEEYVEIQEKKKIYFSWQIAI